MLKLRILLFLVAISPELLGAKADSLVLGLKIQSKISLIELKVNGRNAVFIVDTGSSISLVDEAKANMYKFKSFPAKGQGKIQGLGGKNSFNITSRIKLSYADKFRCNHKFYACNLSNIISVFERKNKSILGILGADFFLKYKAVIDYDKKSLIIY